MTDLTRLFRHASAARARGVLWLALLALTLRALVPTGYMPDARALHDGRLEVTFCSAAGDFSTFSLALNSRAGGPGNPGKLGEPANPGLPGESGAPGGFIQADAPSGKPAHEAAETGAQCPFGLLAHVAPAPLPFIHPIVLPAGRYAAPPVTYRALPALAAQGPPLGPRAPPPLV